MGSNFYCDGKERENFNTPQCSPFVHVSRTSSGHKKKTQRRKITTKIYTDIAIDFNETSRMKYAFGRPVNVSICVTFEEKNRRALGCTYVPATLAEHTTRARERVITAQEDTNKTDPLHRCSVLYIFRRAPRRGQ